MTSKPEQFYDTSTMYDTYKPATIELNYSFLNEMLTQQAIKMGTLDDRFFFDVQSVEIDDENRTIIFHTDVFKYISQ